MDETEHKGVCFMGKKKNSAGTELVDYKDILIIYGELDKLKERHPDIVAEVNPKLAKKTIFEYVLEVLQNLGERHCQVSRVSKKTYCRLCLMGMFGIHHFYSRHWIKGLVYLMVSWTGISVGLTLIDWMAAFPKKPDDEGMILL